MGKLFGEKERKRLRERHRKIVNRRHAYRINALLLLDDNWSYEEVAEVLMLDDYTIRRWEKTYQSQGIEKLLSDDFHGRDGKLTPEQELELRGHLEETLYQTTKEIVCYVQETFGVGYSIAGLHRLLGRLGFVYKKARKLPQKVDEEVQRQFIETYKKLQETKETKSKLLFVDGVHPQHNTIAANGWILKGKEYHIPSNTGRERLNLNGALDPKTLEVTIRADETLNADSTIEFFQELEAKYPLAPVIYLILDNARYYRANKVKEFLKTSRIELIFLPPYSPNLNLIERLWRFFKKEVLYNKFYKKFVEFKDACFGFFETIDSRKHDLKTLITENFQIINPNFRSR